MTRAELEALARRVETEEPSRLLDAEVLVAFGHKVKMFAEDDWGWRDAREHYPRGYDGWSVPMPSPTTSRDAAASLCPPAWWAEVKDLDEADGAWSCVLTHSLLPKKAWGNAPTEPRARTAAALRALATEASDA